MNKKDKEALVNVFKDKIKDLGLKAEALQKAVKELKETGINENLLYHAIQCASQKYAPAYNKIGVGEVKAICKGIEGIKDYLFPLDKDNS